MSVAELTGTVAVLEQLPRISLAQLQVDAAFLTRIDRKYVVPETELVDLLGEVEPGTRALEIDGRRIFGYSTRYFDDDNAAYFRALRKRSNRFKVRTRRYDESLECLLEVKLIDVRGRTVKTRFPHDPERLESLSALDRAWLQSFEPVRSVAAGLEPSIATHYRRATLVFPDSAGRMTIDHGLTFICPRGNWKRLDGQCIVEIKGLGHALPFDRLLWSAGYRPVPASKFALGVALMYPELPDNRWHRLRSRLSRSLVEGECWSGGPLALEGSRSAA